MSSSKELRRRIKSIRSTRQITKAMELVSAAKMRKAQAAALASRTYAKLAWELIQSVSGKVNFEVHNLLRKPDEVNNVGILLVTSNRGLIGGFNNNIISKALQFAKRFPSVEFLVIGKKGRDAVKKRGFTIAAEFEKKDTLGGVEEFLPVARLLIDDFVSSKYDKVVLVYMDFISTLRQQPRVRELLPLLQTADETLRQVGDLSLNPSPRQGRGGRGMETLSPDEERTGERSNLIDGEYLFEPSPDSVLEVLLPRLTELQIYQAYLETDASEHSARMVAMKNASDAAGDLIDELNLEYNQARQAAITKEISEIVAGKLALTN